jgi:hypothetical protein
MISEIIRLYFMIDLGCFNMIIRYQFIFDRISIALNYLYNLHFYFNFVLIN